MRVEIGGIAYNVKDEIDVEGGLEWVRRYWVEPKDGVKPDEVEASVMRFLAKRFEDIPFLIERLVTDENGKPVKVPFHHIPALAPHLRAALHVGEFIDAMVGDRDADAPTEPGGGEEKNLQNG